ncbi:MAG: transketolase [Candidatus Paceibacterota bacterium]|jgi:transketolase
MIKRGIRKLKEQAKKLRRDVLDLALEKGDGHLGGSFSEIEILISLYQKILTRNDKFILSKGHACYPLYIILREKGLQPKISGHPDIDITNGICCTTGSLGHGLPIAVGMALARKLMKKKGRIYVLLGDGEIQEGTTWEASLTAAHHKLNNLVVIIDKNNFQALEAVKNVVFLKNLKKVFQEIGYYVVEINGHSFPAIIKNLKKKIFGKPLLIIANTTKGKGVSFMENDPKWHARQAILEEVKNAYKELE